MKRRRYRQQKKRTARNVLLGNEYPQGFKSEAGLEVDELMSELFPEKFTPVAKVAKPVLGETLAVLYIILALGISLYCLRAIL